MARRRSQLRMCNPDVLLLFALLARPHRHARILRTKLLSTSTISAQESRLAPRAASVETRTQLSDSGLDRVLRRIAEIEVLPAARRRGQCIQPLAPVVSTQRVKRCRSFGAIYIEYPQAGVG